MPAYEVACIVVGDPAGDRNVAIGMGVSMYLKTYRDVRDFLRVTRDALEEHEAANALMLGICLRLQESPGAYGTEPYLAVVAEDDSLLMATVMTPPHNAVLYYGGAERPQALDFVVGDMLTHGWSVPGGLGPSPCAKAFAEAWTRATGGQHRAHMRQKVYELRQVIAPRLKPGRLRVATEDDLDLVVQWVRGFHEDISSRMDATYSQKAAVEGIARQDVYLWEDSNPVSMAARRRPTSHGITVSLVYTPPEYRRRGYATACVASLSQLLLDSGYDFCALHADLANPVSNAIYRKIGYRPVCDLAEYVFGD